MAAKKKAAKKKKKKTATTPSKSKAKPSAKAATASITSALEQLEAGDRDGALVSLLTIWRATASPAIADAIDALSKDLSERQPPIRAVGKVSATKAWDALADVGNPSTFGRLLEVLPEAIVRIHRLEAFLAFDRDPRVTPFASQWFDVPPVHGSNRRGFFWKLVELLDKTNDVRMLPKLTELTSAARKSRTIHASGQTTWKPLLALAEKLAKVQPKSLSAAEQEALSAIEALIKKGAASASSALGGAASAGDPRSFFAKVYANPDDDEARAVLSDLLQQRGDPRGEFIALQLARHGVSQDRRTDTKPTPRERELEDQWGREWLGKIEPAINRGGVVFERGFLARCRFAGGSAGEASVGAEEWSTVIEVDCTTASGFVGYSHEMLRAPPARRAMRHVLALSTEELKHYFADEAGFAWETLGVRLWRWSAITALMNGPKKTFPNVKKLVLRHAHTRLFEIEPAGLAELLAKWPKVEELDISMPASQIAPLMATPHMLAMRRLSILTENEIVFELEPKAKTLRVEFGNLYDSYVPLAKRVLESVAKTIGPGVIDRIDIARRGRMTLDETKTTLNAGGRWQKMTITPLRTLAKERKLTLSVLGQEIA